MYINTANWNREEKLFIDRFSNWLDFISDAEDDEGEAGAEEALEQVAHHVVGRGDFN